SRNARYDYLTLNHFADVSGGDVGMTLSNRDAYFMRAGASTITRLDDATPQISPVLGAGKKTLGFDMISKQAGGTSVVQDFPLRPHGAFTTVEAIKFPLEHQNPLVTGLVSGTAGYPPDAYSLLSIGDPKVLLWSLKPSEEGIARGLIVRAWNLSEDPSRFTLSLTPGLQAARKTTHIETDVADVALENGRLPGSAAGMQLVTYRLTPG